MACDMSKLANFSTEKQQLIALGIDTYTGDVANYVAKDVDTSAGSMDDVMRERLQRKFCMTRSLTIVFIVNTRMTF